MGRDYWQPLLTFFRDRLLREHTIDPIDAERILVTDSAEEAVTRVTDTAMKRFGLTYGPQVRRKWILGE
jgi:predicted Rossmann-fold nucleotide-binding protein